MAVYDKIQRSLLGKCCLPSGGAALTEALHIGARARPEPPPEEEIILQHSEEWILGPPPMGSPLHSEEWTLPDVPTLTLQHSEAWSS